MHITRLRIIVRVNLSLVSNLKRKNGINNSMMQKFQNANVVHYISAKTGKSFKGNVRLVVRV
jgi:NMD protein affecting ribosome stability and mRNA decay